MTDFKLLDSSIWLEYFFNGSFAEIIGSSAILYVSALSLFEIKRKLVKEKTEPQNIKKSLEFVTKRCIVVNISAEIAEMAVDLSLHYELSTADAIIYAGALVSQASFITRDNDFRGIPKVIIMR